MKNKWIWAAVAVVVIAVVAVVATQGEYFMGRLQLEKPVKAEKMVRVKMDPGASKITGKGGARKNVAKVKVKNLSDEVLFLDSVEVPVGGDFLFEREFSDISVSRDDTFLKSTAVEDDTAMFDVNERIDPQETATFNFDAFSRDIAVPDKHADFKFKDATWTFSKETDGFSF